MTNTRLEGISMSYNSTESRCDLIQIGVLIHTVKSD